MTKNVTLLVAFCLCIFLAACTSDNQASKKADKSAPRNIAGLKVEGARSKQNVIHNLWPFVCRAQELYRERLKDNPDLKGIFEIRITVEFNGEIGPYAVVRNTLGDEVFEKQLKRLIQFQDFDSFGPHNSETVIVLPMHFKP